MREFSPPTMCHVSRVTCHMSRVTCHVSSVKKSGGASQGKVYYQWAHTI